MSGLFEALHELVQKDHLAAGDHQAVDGIQVVLAPSVVFLRTLEQEGVVARLLELSDDVQKGDLPALTSLHSNTAQTQTRDDTCPLGSLPLRSQTGKGGYMSS